MLGSGAGGENNLQTISAKPTHKLSKTLKPYNFPWTSSSCSPSSVCTSLPRAHCPNTYLYLSSVLRYKCRDVVSTRTSYLIVFSLIFALSLVGGIGLAARAASGNGKGLCEGLSPKHPENCTEAACALAFAWLSVVIGVFSALLSLSGWPDYSIAGAGIAIAWFDRSSRTGSLTGPDDWKEPAKDPEEFKSTFRSSHSYVPGPTASYVPRPRDPYDTPRRKRSTHSQSQQTGPQRVPSRRGPAAPLPPLPAFHPLGLEADATVDRRANRRQSKRPMSEQSEQKNLPELPPPTRRPPEDPHKKEIRKIRHISPTDLFAEMG